MEPIVRAIVMFGVVVNLVTPRLIQIIATPQLTEAQLLRQFWYMYVLGVCGVIWLVWDFGYRQGSKR